MESLILFISFLIFFGPQSSPNKENRYDKDATVDCAGVVGGTDKIDNCGVCDSDETNDCLQDCAGQWGGTAVIDCLVGCTKKKQNVALWGECYSIRNTKVLHRPNSWLTGRIPSEIGQLKNLTTISLGYNNLSGEIPLEIWTLTNLTTLSLYYNQFSGTISEDIGQLKNLIYLYLDDNNLNGEIPLELCIPGFFSPYLTDNKFCPPYPACLEGYVGEQDTSECAYCITNPNDPDCN